MVGRTCELSELDKCSIMTEPILLYRNGPQDSNFAFAQYGLCTPASRMSVPGNLRLRSAFIRRFESAWPGLFSSVIPLDLHLLLLLTSIGNCSRRRNNFGKKPSLAVRKVRILLPSRTRHWTVRWISPVIGKITRNNPLRHVANLSTAYSASSERICPVHLMRGQTIYHSVV